MLIGGPKHAAGRELASRWVWLGLLLALGLAPLLAPFWLAGPRRAVPPINATGAELALTSELLTVMTMNVAHGRREGPHQILLSRATIQANLDDIAALLERERPQVVALQEVDGPSFWSGGFDQVARLGARAHYAQYVRAEQVQGFTLYYGNALLSQLALSDPAAVTFQPALFAPPKGLVVGTVHWPNEPSQADIDVVSLHLDPARAAVRERQARELVQALQHRGRPLVIMGDFNSELHDDESTLRDVCGALGLHAYRPDASLPTFPSASRRLDWILISRELEFERVEVLPDPLSDHRFVVAVLRHLHSHSRGVVNRE